MFVAALVAAFADAMGTVGVRGGVAAGADGEAVAWGVELAELVGADDVGGATEEGRIFVADGARLEEIGVLILGSWGFGRRWCCYPWAG